MILYLKTLNKPYRIALLFFLVSAFYGLLMRIHKIYPIPEFKYAHFIQAHSHVTFLGWGFLGIISLIMYAFLDHKGIRNRSYRIFYYTMVYSLLGLLVSFPIQGYKLFSIAFLTVFLLSSYVFLGIIWRDLRTDTLMSTRFIKTGIVYYYVSSLAIWAVAIITVNYGKTDLYRNAIYFYLHFLYNGFFVFSLFGLLIRYIENQKIVIKQISISLFYILTNLAVIPAYALSLLWNDVSVYIVSIGFIAVLLQIGSLYFLRPIHKVISVAFQSKKNLHFLVSLVFISYYTKIILQFLSAFPKITQLAVMYKPFFVIGYIHLFTLGFMSVFMLVLYQIYSGRLLAKVGQIIFVIGIISSELLLFSQGLCYYVMAYNIPHFNLILLLVSSFMPLGLIGIITKRK